MKYLIVYHISYWKYGIVIDNYIESPMVSMQLKLTSIVLPESNCTCVINASMIRSTNDIVQMSPAYIKNYMYQSVYLYCFTHISDKIALQRCMYTHLMLSYHITTAF